VAVAPAATVADPDCPDGIASPRLMPVPETGTACGLPEALSVTVTLAFRIPVAFGSKTTLMVQFAPAASVFPQVFVCKNSLACGPETATSPILSCAVPVFRIVIACAVAEEPTNWLANVRNGGERLTNGPYPVPAKLTV